jgi:hypothetical protein
LCVVRVARRKRFYKQFHASCGSSHGTRTRSARYQPANRYHENHEKKETDMGFGRSALLWLLGVPIPIIILLALFWHH